VTCNEEDTLRLIRKIFLTLPFAFADVPFLNVIYVIVSDVMCNFDIRARSTGGGGGPSDIVWIDHGILYSSNYIGFRGLIHHINLTVRGSLES